MTIYLDMDGVIADFFGGLEVKYGVDHWKSVQDREIKFKELANTNFFYTLPIFREDRGPRRAGPSISCEIIRFVKEISHVSQTCKYLSSVCVFRASLWRLLPPKRRLCF